MLHLTVAFIAMASLAIVIWIVYSVIELIVTFFKDFENE